MKASRKKSPASAKAAKPFVRLPSTVRPVHYKLVMEPNFEDHTFKVKEWADIVVAEGTNTIVLHAKELSIQSVSISRADGKKMDARVELDAATETAAFRFDDVVEAGEWKLFGNFSGVLNDRLKGFYRSVWNDSKGFKHVIATTQFEATDARAAYLCFDEPGFKATFEMQLVGPQNLQAISNGEPLREEVLPGTGKKVSYFETTMKMSTYPTAMIMGEFEHTAPVWVNGTKIQIWCRPGKLDLTGPCCQICSPGAG